MTYIEKFSCYKVNFSIKPSKPFIENFKKKKNANVLLYKDHNNEEENIKNNLKGSENEDSVSNSSSSSQSYFG